MNKIILTLACLFLAVQSGMTKTNSGAIIGKTNTNNAVLVELFTSEGCSSCPPADKVLTALQAQPVPGVEIITLSEHVPYWNNLGWTDPFSQEIFSNRQQHYVSVIKNSSAYTPQMVIDGKTEFVGSNYSRAIHTIKAAALRPKETISLSLPTETSEHLSLKGSVSTSHKGGTCYGAVVEDSLFSSIKAGENSGIRLGHTSVVREWIDMGNVGRTGQLQFEREVPIKNSWNANKLRVVVFLQDPDGQILAVAASPHKQ